MTKHTITRACGHEDEVEIDGPKRGREKRLKRERRFTCRACYFEKQRAEAEVAAEAHDLPALTGTPRQVAWAMTLRHKAIDEMERYLGELRGERKRLGVFANKRALFEAGIDRAVQRLIGQTEAAWWIDRRFDPAPALLDSD